ncbi:hypothetical protein ANO14919_036640 [Xylariales sp. No.14919]|nr:hypothetical protein ANO14919_036640 [Xylariales sp. No.14919]
MESWNLSQNSQGSDVRTDVVSATRSWVSSRNATQCVITTVSTHLDGAAIRGPSPGIINLLTMPIVPVTSASPQLEDEGWEADTNKSGPRSFTHRSLDDLL